MTPVSIAVLACSMSADACAAAIARGASLRPSFASAVKSGLVFGTIEAVTPVAGWAVGLAASAYIAAIDHWVAFVLLAAVGGKMAYESLGRIGESITIACGGEAVAKRSGVVGLVLTAVETSIDAAAVGVTLALIGANILAVALAIGLTTFTLATGGMLLGRSAGRRLGPIVELVGGLGLIAIGVIILLEHTGYIG